MASLELKRLTLGENLELIGLIPGLGDDFRDFFSDVIENFDKLKNVYKHLIEDNKTTEDAIKEHKIKLIIFDKLKNQFLLDEQSYKSDINQLKDENEILKIKLQKLEEKFETHLTMLIALGKCVPGFEIDNLKSDEENTIDENTVNEYVVVETQEKNVVDEKLEENTIDENAVNEYVVVETQEEENAVVETQEEENVIDENGLNEILKENAIDENSIDEKPKEKRKKNTNINLNQKKVKNTNINLSQKRVKKNNPKGKIIEVELVIVNDKLLETKLDVNGILEINKNNSWEFTLSKPLTNIENNSKIKFLIEDDTFRWNNFEIKNEWITNQFIKLEIENLQQGKNFIIISGDKDRYESLNFNLRGE